MYPVGQGSSGGPPGPGPVGPPSSNTSQQQPIHTGGWGGTISDPHREGLMDPPGPLGPQTATTISGGLGTTGIGLGIGPVIGSTPNPLGGLTLLPGDSPPGSSKTLLDSLSFLAL